MNRISKVRLEQRHSSGQLGCPLSTAGEPVLDDHAGGRSTVLRGLPEVVV